LCAIYSFLNVQQLNYGRCWDGSGRRPDGSRWLLVGLALSTVSTNASVLLTLSLHYLRQNSD